VQLRLHSPSADTADENATDEITPNTKIRAFIFSSQLAWWEQSNDAYIAIQ
jgi:hypothetical protein